MLNNLQTAQLFDRCFVANTLKNSCRCSKCCNKYNCHYDKFIKDFHVKSNRPILLPCGHNMCENCVYNNRHNLTCGTCLKPVIIQKEPAKQFSNFNVRDYFDMNFFLMGQLNHWRFYRKDGSANNTLLVSASGRSILNSSNLLDANASVTTSSVIKCVECECAPSLGKCRVCKAYYCKRCYDNVHKNSKVLKMHSLQRFDKEPTKQAEIMRLTKARYCKKHQRQCDRYCQKCDLVCCGECGRQDHQHHHYRKLKDENEKLLDELHVIMDNAQLARESLNKGQKDIKSVETQLEEYATKTLEEISNYYVQLHSFLQNEEKEITEKFNEMCQQPQFMLREASTKLNESQETLNSIRSTLEQFENSPPANFYLGHILPKYNQLIQQIPTNIQITKPHSNPFIFEIKHDIRHDLHNTVNYNYKDPKIFIKIDSSFYDSNPSIVDTTTTSMPSTLNIMQNKSVSPKPKTNNKKNKKNNKNKNITANEDISMTNITATPNANHDSGGNLVHITNIKTPENFYIQNVNDIYPIRKLSHTYLLNALANNIPKIIAEGYYYMAYHVTDKQWYRGMLKKILPNDLYKIFLVDFGISMEVSKDKLCDIEENHLKLPFAAIRCAIYDIMPVGKKWTEVENNLLLELLHNKPARISIIEKVSSDMLKIDLHTDLSKSVHDTFLYTGLARKRPGAHSFKLQFKVNLPVIKIEERIPKINIQTSEILSVTVLHVEGPEEFYVIKNELIESKEELRRELNQYYRSNSVKLQQIYLGTVQMCCAVNINDLWYRAIIEEIKDRGQLNVRLVDEGRREIINWRQAFVLNEQFRKKREFAIPCTLADIEPLQENKYVYTLAAIKDFKQMTTNPHLRMEVVAATVKICKVALYICKKSLDINIGATLVKNKYGISTGESTQITEVVKTPKGNNNNQQHPFNINSNEDNLKTMGTAAKPIKRSLVKVTHLVSPGEFYIQLTNLVQGTKTFHQQIQEAQAKKFGAKVPMPYETREWYENNHCIVYTKYHSSQSPHPVDGPLREHFEWYRGIITKITYLPGKEPTFSVFLRDIGVTICSIYSQQLYTIDAQLDRVTNAVYCCHLACIEPAGGSTWSQSAIDSFKHYVMTGETLSVSLHPKRHQNKDSLAIVLWSSKMETSNPLAPCTTKYSNINRNLVRKGLAYMVEPLDTKQQFDQIEEMELANGEITMEEWFKTFSDNVLLKEIENTEKQPLHLSLNTDAIETNEYYMDDHPLSIHLTEMDFKDTTGQKAPAAWFTSKIITKTLFSGYPTYIDFDCIVYLHEADDKKFLEKVTKKLTETYGPMESSGSDHHFSINQACVVKYHVDGKYYRGIITENINSQGEWGVQFIDYGNVETVEGKDLRAYAPYPNLPAMASKYIIDGIKPKNGADKFNTGELDQIHAMIVTKFVSMRIQPTELHKNIKRCNMRLGAQDVATEIIGRGLAEADYTPLFDAANEAAALNLSQLEGDLKPVTAHKPRKSRNPLPVAPMEDYAIFSQATNINIDCVYKNINDAANDDEDDPDLSDNSNDDNNGSGKIDNLNEMLDRLSKKSNAEQQFAKPMAKTTTETTTTNKPPPPKKRMFNDKDYTKMMNVMMVYDTDDILDDFEHDFDQDYKDNHYDGEEEDEDIIELGESFAMNYWHNTVEDMRVEEDEEINEQLNRRSSTYDEFDIESDFDGFHPNETSTVFSHFSGIENFKPPQLPVTMHHFNCSVVSIITPTILQIFPHHTEFRYRELELQRSIKEIVKRSLPPLTKFEPRTLCLACYTKDKIWYRAIIRSYNPNAKTVDVLYVDYLNSETLPLKYIRQCPKELLGWPLRTFRVRLHGIQINPHVKEHDVRMALHRLLTKRKLFAVVKKHPNYNSLVLDNNPNNADLIEIALYESKDTSLKGVTIYESLFEKNYFQRY